MAAGERGVGRVRDGSRGEQPGPGRRLTWKSAGGGFMLGKGRRLIGGEPPSWPPGRIVCAYAIKTYMQ